MSLESDIEATSDPAALVAIAPDIAGADALADVYMIRAAALGCMSEAAKALIEAEDRSRREESAADERAHAAMNDRPAAMNGHARPDVAEAAGGREEAAAEAGHPRADEGARAVAPAARDPLVGPGDLRAVMRRYAGEGRTYEEYVAALRTGPPHPIGDIETMVAFGALRLLWDHQAVVELLGEIGPRPSWNGDGLETPADLAAAVDRMIKIMPDPRVGGVLFGAAAGIGKTLARLVLIRDDVKKRRERSGGPLIAPGRSRKQAAHLYTVPALRLAKELEERAVALGLSVYILRGRGQPDPEERGAMDESRSKLMCWKDGIRDPAATASADQKSEMCGSEDNPCRALGLCHYSTQAREIRELNPDLIIIPHAGLRTVPLARAAIPEFLTITCDEELAIDAMLTSTSRRFGDNAALRLSALDLDDVVDLVRERALTPALAALQALAGSDDATKAREEADRRVRGAREALETVAGLRDVVRSCAFDGGVDFPLIRKVFGLIGSGDMAANRADRVAGLLRSCKRPIFEPKDWKTDDGKNRLADAAWKLATTRELLKYVIAPALSKDRPGMIPALRFEMVPVESKAKEKTFAPFLRFAFVRGFAKPFRDRPTILMDATPEPRFARSLFPDIVVSDYAACPKHPDARIVVVPEGFGKSAMLKPNGDATPKAGAAWLLFQGLRLAYGDRGGVGFISHKEAVLKLRTELDDDPLISWHGAIRGVDLWSGCAALVVVGSSTPSVRDAELATEALIGRVVDREPDPERGPWVNWRTADVAVQQRPATAGWHRDPGVAAYLHQVTTAGIAQAAARARFVRNPVLLIILGRALDHLPPGSAEVMDWSEIEPDKVDRMLIEERIAFGRETGQALFPWLKTDPSKYISKEMLETSFLRSRLLAEGWRIVAGRVRLKGRRQAVRAIRLEGPDGEGPDMERLAREGFEWIAM